MFSYLFFKVVVSREVKLQCSWLWGTTVVWCWLSFVVVYWWSLLVPDSKAGCAEALMEMADVLWELPTCLLSHVWWPLPLSWFPGPLCQHTPSGCCQKVNAPALPFALKHFVVLGAFLRVSDLRHSWLPDVRAAQLAWSPCQASLLWPFIFTFHIFFPNHPRGTESFSLLIKQFVSSTYFSCGPWRSLSLFSSGLG